jgi:mono/diheme cytochrome c family protein
MRHVIVTRVVSSVAVLGAAAILAFTGAAVRRGGAPDARPPQESSGPGGAALFERHCAACHEEAGTARTYRAAADRAAARAELGSFLEGHFGPSPEAAALIAEHLLAGQPQR